MNTLQKCGEHILSWFLPERCMFCGEVIPPLTLRCDTCARELWLIKPPLCRYCGHSKTDCHCGKHRHRYDRVAAPFYCDDAAHRGVLRLKRYDDPRAIAFFADQMTAVYHREFCDEQPVAVLAVPMTRRAQFERGYNQSELLARAVAQRIALPYRDALRKRYETPSQKTMHAWQRAGNVLGAFDVADVADLAGQTVLLVDDVCTTGATADECAKMLKIYGVGRVLLLATTIRQMVFQPKEEGSVL